MLLFFILMLGLTFFHFMVYSKKPTLPILLLMFYCVRFFSELSLILYKPEHNIWEDFKILGINIKSDFFNSNVDPITGVIYCCAYYFFCEIGHDDKKIKIFIFSSFVFFFLYVLFMHFTFQLLYSFALYAALLDFVFSAFVTYEIELKFFKKTNNKKIKEKEDDEKSI